MVVAGLFGSSNMHAQHYEREQVSLQHALAFVPTRKGVEAVDHERMTASLALLLRQMHLSEQDLPHILVIQPTPEVAHATGATQSTVRRANPSGGPVYYELWIVGPPKPAEYITGLHLILEEYFSVQISDADRKSDVLRVMRVMDATVSAHGNAGAHGGQ